MSSHAHSIKTRITFYFVAILIVAIALVSVTSYFAGRKLLKDSAFNTVNSIRTIKTGQVEQYITMLQDQCLSLSESTMTAQALEALQEGFNQLQAPETKLAAYKKELEKFYTDDFLPKLNKTAENPYSLSDYLPLDTPTIIAQSWYLAENPQPLQKKVDYARAQEDNLYNTAHEQYHSIFKRYADRVVIADLYLIDLTTGYVTYSLAKEIDFGSNLITGPLKDTGLGRAFVELQRTNDEDFVKIIDFQFYTPSYGTPVGFIGTPIFKHGKKVGGLVFKFPIDTINQIMTYDKHWAEVGLGKSGETFLIGKDKYMRTIAREYIENPTDYIRRLREHGYDPALLDKIQVYDTTVLLKKIDLDITRDILAGKTNTLITKDTMGDEVIYSYSPIKVKDVEWFILVKIDTQEAFEPINTLLWYIALCGLLVIFLSACAAFIATFIATKPLMAITQALNHETFSTHHKLLTSTTTEFATISDAYNRIIDQSATLTESIQAVEHEMRSHECTALEQGTALLKNNNQLNTLNAQLREKNNQALLALHAADDSTHQQTSFGTQAVTVLTLIETTHTSVMHYIEEICSVLASADANLSTDTPESLEAHTKLQQAVRLCSSITPLLINAANSCRQITNLFEGMHTTQEQKNQVTESLSALLREECAVIGQLESLIARNETDIGEIQHVIQNYTQSADTLKKILSEMHT